jgi:arabinose-5-phosphate isomerase
MAGHVGCNAEQVMERARRVLQVEADALLSLREQLGPPFLELVRLILACPGKVVLSGVGKSGIVGSKVAATLCSTGTPAVSLDPLAALHGDLGIVAHGDVLLAISNSGESEELLNVVEAAREIGATVVALTGDTESTLARSSHHVVPVKVEQEACPLGLAPTASTAAVMAVGDALAMALLEQRRFSPQDYAAFHPGGSLGRRLKLRVRDLMRAGDAVPKVPITATLGEALREMSERDNLGVTFVVDEHGALRGIVTDGDLRRVLRRGGADVAKLSVSDVMTPRPKVVDADAMASEALRIMELHSITSLGIMDADNRPVGIILLHDILGRGKFMI